MKLQRLRNSVSRAAMVATCVAAVVACSEPADIQTPSDPDDIESGEVVIAVSELSTPRIGTRVMMTDDADNPQAGDTVGLRWDEGDTFSLWAAGGDERPEYKNIKFTYKGSDKYGAGDKVYFSSREVPLMTEGEYIYTAYYPYQDNDELVDRANNRISYEIPTTQDGTYGGKYDIMTAHAVRSKALVRDWLNDGLDLEFAHETHALKITVPESSNLFGHDITRIRIEFPQPVAGRLSFDAVTGKALTDGIVDNIIDVQFDEPLVPGEPFWVFIAPTEISGEVKFSAYGGEDEIYMNDPSIAPEGAFTTLAKGHITPVKLGLKEAFTVTWFDFEVADWSRLGEEVEIMHFTLPEGIRTADRSEDENSVYTAYPDAQGHFGIPFRSGELDKKTAGGNLVLTARYESEHAIVDAYASDAEKFTIASGDYTPGAHHLRTIDFAPYLFEEDFNGITGKVNHDDDLNLSSSSAGYGSNNAYSFSNAGLDGWTGARCGAYPGGYVRILQRSQYAGALNVFVPGSYHGRIDSPAMVNLKDGASVKLTLSFNYSMDRARNDSKYDFIQHYFAVGAHTTAGTINAVGDTNGGLGTAIGDVAIDLDISTTEMSTEINLHKEYETLTECTNQHRFVWDVYANSFIPSPSGWGAAGDYQNYWLYIDNVKVSIAQ